MKNCKESKNWDEIMKINICRNRTCEDCIKWKRDWENKRKILEDVNKLVKGGVVCQ